VTIFTGTRRTTFVNCASITLFALVFFLPPLGLAQEKPQTPSSAPRKPLKRSPAQTTEAKSQQDPVDQHFRAAETFQLAGDLQSTEVEYRRVISLALQRLAAFRVLAQDDSQAVALLQSAVAAEPSDAEAQISLASMYFRSGDLMNAKALLQSVLSKNERQLAAKSLLGKIFFTEGDYAAAATQLRDALGDNSDLDAAYSLALTYLKLDQVANATNVFDEMLVALGSSAELHILIGRGYLEAGKFDLASAEFRKALQLNPAAPRAHSYLGTVFLREKGDAALPEARREFQAELARDPADYSSHFYLGVIQFKEHQYAPAQHDLSEAIRLAPESPEAYFYLGQTQFEGGDREDAVVQLRKSIELYGNSPEAEPVHQALAKALESLGRRDEAQREASVVKNARASASEQAGSASAPKDSDSAKEMRKMLASGASATGAGGQKVPPQYLAALKEALGNAYHNLGVIYAQRGQYAESADLFADAAKWSSDIKALDRNWGTASFRAKKYEMAIQPLDRVLRSKPDDPNVRQMLALSYFMTNNFQKSAETFRPILDSLPDTPSLLYAAGISLARSGDSQGASAIFRRMLEHGSNSAEVHLFLGQAHDSQKEDADALEEFARALELNPQLAQAHYGVGMVHLRQGNIEQAEKDFRAEIAVNPGDPSTEFRLGHILVIQQRHAEAVELLTDVVRQKPDDADTEYELGIALLGKGDLKPATERLETAVRLKPDQAFAYYQLSIAYRRQGRLQEADATLRHYEKIKATGPKASSDFTSEKPL